MTGMAALLGLGTHNGADDDDVVVADADGVCDALDVDPAMNPIESCGYSRSAAGGGTSLLQ